MSKQGAHFTIPQAISYPDGYRLPWQCPHVHVSGRRCTIRVVARSVYCTDHQLLDRDDHCAECREMMRSFGVSTDA